jgi:SpoVK/Ycf46/Vps4 family AAA+-type ATPase
MKTMMIHNDDSISTRLFAKWICERYDFSMDKVTKIQEETFFSILEDQRFHQTLKLRGGRYHNSIAFNDEAMVILTQEQIDEESEKAECFFEIFAKDVQTYKRYYEEIVARDDSVKSKNIMVEYISFSLANHGVIESTEYLKKELFENVAGDVYEPYLDVEILFEEFLNSKSPILQFTGKPGLGKSKLISLFIKYMLSRDEYLSGEGVLKIARPTESGVLASDEFWVQLRQSGCKALILDDIDYILQQRNETISSSEDKTHNDIVNKMLTFTDGLLHQKTKILITTNVSYKRIDKALSRDFRLFDSIELRALSSQEALGIWQSRFKLKEAQFFKIFHGENEITPARLASEAEKICFKAKKQEQFQRNYCKEKGISKIDEIRISSNGRTGFL